MEGIDDPFEDDPFPLAYSFDLLDVTDLLEFIPVTFGETVDGGITSVGAEQRFTFNGTSDQNIFIDFVSFSGELSYELVSPSGRVVDSVFSSDSQNPDSELTLRETGQYEFAS